jgi:hypothetical protein
MRCLKDRPLASDLFGINGRRCLAEQQSPLCERETVATGRQVDFLDKKESEEESRDACRSCASCKTTTSRRPSRQTRLAVDEVGGSVTRNGGIAMDTASRG